MASQAQDKTFQAAVVKAKKDNPEATWKEIAAKLKESDSNKVWFTYLCATVKPADRIKTDDEQALAKAIVKARNVDQQSWPQIMARSGLTQGKVRSIYTEATGVDTKGLANIGKGGRTSNGAGTPVKTKPVATKKVAETRAAKKVARATTPRKAINESDGGQGDRLVNADKVAKHVGRPAKKAAPRKVATKKPATKEAV